MSAEIKLESASQHPRQVCANILQQIQSDIHYEATHKKGLAWLVLTIEKRIEAEAKQNEIAERGDK